MKHFLYITLAMVLSTFATAQNVIDIADARTMNVGEVVTLTGTVTSGSELGNIRYYADQTGSFAAFSPTLSTVSRHDSITITGTISFFNGLMQLSPVEEFTNHGPAVVQIEPVTIDLAEIGEETESQLVSVSDVVFADGGSTFTGNSTFQISSGGTVSNVYIRNGNPLVGTFIPVSPVDLVAISSQFSFSGEGGFQLLPRDEDDFSSPNPINIISAVEVDMLTQSGFTVNWITDVASTSGMFYTDNIDGTGLEDNFVDQPDDVTNHTLTVSNLEAGQVYFARVFSVAGQDTAFSPVLSIATVSTSSGEIKAYFNGSVVHDVAEPAENLAETANLRSKMIEFIGMAQNTLDIAAYNINDNPIINALNQAHANGVQIRYIGEGQTANVGLNNLNGDIPILIRQNSEGSGMHNKFIVVDYEDMDNARVLTGSTNFTTNQIDVDFNHIVTLQDRSLAKAYTIEFNEMWGGSGTEPNPLLSRFGPDKTINTPREFVIGGNKVELYFSPSDNTTGGILDALATTDASVNFALLVFTVAEIADVLIDLNNSFFITVQGMMDDVTGTGTEFDHLTDNFVQVLHHNVGQLHHKYAIVDNADLSSDPLVITGSHNWSASANNVNDENTLVIHSPSITNQFFQEWMGRWHGLTLSSSDFILEDFSIFPNPATDLLNLSFSVPASSSNRIIIADVTGKLIQQINLSGVGGRHNVQLDVQHLPQGMYLMSIDGEWGSHSEKFLKN